MSYVDNLELSADEPGALYHGLGVLQEFCSIMDVELDTGKLYGWALTSTDRAILRGYGLNIEYAARDVGGQVNYGRKKHTAVVVDRIRAVLPQFDVLRRSLLAPAQKMLCIAGALFPRGLHGCENVQLGATHFSKFRSKVMQAMKWDRAGASPLARPGLAFPGKLDAAYYQFRHVICLFRRQCLKSSSVRIAWQTFVRADARRSVGPFAKLQEQLCLVHWYLDDEFILHVPSRLKFNLLHCAHEELDLLMLHSWRQVIAEELSQRPGYEDLQGICYELVENYDASLTVADREALWIIREGAFFTGDYLSRFDSRVSAECSQCQMLDTVEHRYAVCANYADIHADHSEVLEAWDLLPRALLLHGLPSENPWRSLRWEALQQLGNIPVRFFHGAPVEGHVHVFCDGSCSPPNNPALALASWAIVSPTVTGCIASGGLPGICQTIPRAELYGTLQAIRWGRLCQGTLHLWLDAQYVIDGLRFLLVEGQLPDDISNRDLWEGLEGELQQCLAKVVCHKVSSHLEEDQCTSPLEDWTRFWNACADAAAVAANQWRPGWFSRVHNRYVDHWQTQTQWLKEVSSLHLAIASADLQARQHRRAPMREDEEELIIERRFGTASWTPSESFDESWRRSEHTREFDLDVSFRFCRWVRSLNEDAEVFCSVTLFEIMLGFGCFAGLGESWQGFSQHRNPFSWPTAAAELRSFKQFFRAWCKVESFRPVYSRIALEPVNVLCGLEAVLFPWPDWIEQKVLQTIPQFIGRRPITNCQGLSRPLRYSQLV